MKLIFLTIAFLLAGFGSCSKVQATTISAAMNVSGQGSDYIFVYRGNNPNEFDALVVQGLNNLAGWVVTCGPNQACQGISYIIDHATQPSPDYLYLYTANDDGTTAFPDSGQYYSFRSPPITQTNAPANQTITSGGGSSAGPSNEQQTRYNSWNNGTQAPDNYLYIEQVNGNYNTVNVTQSGTKNTMYVGINGSTNTVNADQIGANYLNTLVQGNTNTVTSLQTNTSGTNYQETKIMSGNNNTINVAQKDNGNSLMFNTVTGSNNGINAVQEGGGNHYLENKLTGNGNSVLANQSGSTGNKANIDLTNAGGPSSVDLQQSGGKSFTIIQSCTNPAGCSTVIRQ
jgi:hypothetical protein